MRQEINAGLNVVENWNSANGFIFYGKSGEISSNSTSDQEVSMLCLHLLQVCVTYVNTLFVQQLFQEENWQDRFRYCSHEISAHNAIHLICIAAKKDFEFLAYRVAMPRHLLRCRNAFSTKCLIL